MTNYAEYLDVDVERMLRQVRFLKDRAIWHQERETPRDIASAGTALRNAAILELLFGNVDEGKSLLISASEKLIGQGILSGYMLKRFALAEEDLIKNDETSILSRLSDSFDEGGRHRGSTEKSDGRYFEVASRNSPRQLLDLYQALRIGGRASSRESANLADQITKRLFVSDSFVVGTTGLSISSYLRLFDNFSTGAPSSWSRNVFSSVFIHRSELLHSAKRDQYHWRRFPNPSGLVDLDLVAFSMNALNANSLSESDLSSVGLDGDPLARLPLSLANDLRGPSLDATPRYEM